MSTIQEFPPFEHQEPVGDEPGPEELALHEELLPGEFAEDEAFEEGLVDEEELGDELLAETGEASAPTEADDAELELEIVGEPDGELDVDHEEDLDEYVDRHLLALPEDDDDELELDEDGELVIAELDEELHPLEDGEFACSVCHLVLHRALLAQAGGSICKDCAESARC